MSDLYPAYDLATFLSGTLALPNPPGGSQDLSFVDGGNLMVGPLRPLEQSYPLISVGVLQGGGSQVPYMGDTGTSSFASRVQVMVRGTVDAFATGEAVARAVYRKLHLSKPAGYISVLAVEADPVYLGPDEDGAHRWSMNFEVRLTR